MGFNNDFLKISYLILGAQLLKLILRHLLDFRHDLVSVIKFKIKKDWLQIHNYKFHIIFVS